MMLGKQRIGVGVLSAVMQCACCKGGRRQQGSNSVRNCFYGNREINAHVVGTAETQALHPPQQKVPAQWLQQHKRPGASRTAKPTACPQPSSGEMGEGRKTGAKPLQVQSMTLNATGVSSRPLTEATENQLPNGSHHRKMEGLRFDVSQHHRPVLVSKARIVGSEMENNCQRKPSQHPPHPKPCPHFTEGGNSCG